MTSSSAAGLGLTRWALAGMAAAAAVSCASAADPLPRLGASLEGVTVSGVSSGAYMAVQFQVAHAQMVKGAGVIAGGPYECASGSATRALNHCMRPGSLTPAPSLDATEAVLARRAAEGSIDPPAALADDRVWVLSGGQDHTVERPVVDALVAFYQRHLPAEAVRYVQVSEAGHAMISVEEPSPNACETSRPPYINRCGSFDAAGELLGQVLGTPLAAKAEPPAGRLLRFDQREYVAGNPSDISLAGEGYVFVPDACQGAGCRVHVVFHGCQQSAEQIGERFVVGAGYNAWAAANRLVVLYPQTVPRNGWAFGSWRWVLNPKGCWDWWGYSGPDYATRRGPQIRAVRAMLDGLAQRP